MKFVRFLAVRGGLLHPSRDSYSLKVVFRDKDSRRGANDEALISRFIALCVIDHDCIKDTLHVCSIM